MNSNGIKNQCDNKKVIYSRGWIFHQIRPVPKEQVVAELGDDPSNPAESCYKLLKSRNVSSGSYYIKIGKVTSLIYCKMENTAECGEGGWTLAMKINGSKETFSYTSQLWTEFEAYKPEEAKDLNDKETKFAYFSNARLTEGLCVGMKVDGHTRWLKIPYKKSVTLYGIFNGNDNELLSIDSSKWKSLINGSSLPDDCTPKGGFNVKYVRSPNGAQARIGLIAQADQKCSGDPVSRIGFGTGGSSGRMHPSNTCGNEFPSISSSGSGHDISIKAFCYILIK